MKSYFVTDAHLGSGADSSLREKQLVDFLVSIEEDADKLFLLGDMFDFWFTYRHVVPRGFVRILGQLARMADKGIEVHYYIGNHDMWMFDYMEREIGVVMHSDVERIELQGKRIMIGHGDGLDAKDRRYNFLKRVFRCRLNQRLFAMVHPGLSFGIANAWSESSRRSHRADCQEYQGDEREGIVQHCLGELAKAPYDYFIFGHRHGQVERTLTSNGRTATYINVGNWIERRDYAVMENGEVRTGQWRGWSATTD